MHTFKRAVCRADVTAYNATVAAAVIASLNEIINSTDATAIGTADIDSVESSVSYAVSSTFSSAI